MNDTNIISEYFSPIKAKIERHVDNNGWKWIQHDSYLLDWAIMNMEAGHE